MEERNKYIEDYILNIREKLKSFGIELTDDQINRVINRYLDSSDPIEEVVRQIDTLTAGLIEDFNRRQQEQIKIEDMKDLQDLPLQYTGITLNNQDIDLMMIAGANNLQELRYALSRITNITFPLNDTELITK